MENAREHRLVSALSRRGIPQAPLKDSVTDLPGDALGDPWDLQGDSPGNGFLVGSCGPLVESLGLFLKESPGKFLGGIQLALWDTCGSLWDPLGDDPLEDP